MVELWVGRRAPSLLLALSLCACASPAPPSVLEALLAREAEPRPETEIAAPDGSFRFRAPGEPIGALEPDPEAGFFGRFDIGTGTPVECMFYSDRRDLAASLVQISAALFQAIARNGIVLDAKAIYAVDAGAAGLSPYLSLGWLVRFGSTAALMKQMIGNAQGRSIWCLHDEVGFSRTFERFFLGLLGSFAAAEPAAEPEFSETILLRVGGANAGFSHVEMRRDEEGDFRIVRVTSSLLRSAPDSILASDGLDVEWSRPDGSLINGMTEELEGGELVTSLELLPAEGAWRVTGTLQGKPFEQEFSAGDALLSELGEYRAQRSLLSRPDGHEIRFLRWLSVSPGEAIECTLTRRQGRADGVVLAEGTAGPVDFEVEIDAQGPRRLALSMGRLAMEMIRAAQSGSL